MTLPDMKSAYDASLDVVPEVDATAHAEDGGVMCMALRMLQSQYVDQLGHTQFYRETYLAAKTIQHARDTGVDVDAAYMRAYGCTFNDLTFVTFAALSAAAANVHAQFNPRDMNAAGAIPNLTQEVIDAVWSLIRIDYAEFQERANAPEVNVAGYETYSLSPTVKWPLVVRSDGNAVAPSAVDLLHRGPRGFYFDSSAALAGDELARFRTAGGSVFEAYVGESLRAAIGSDAVWKAETILAKGDPKCDWIVAERDAFVLVESKTARMRLNALTTMDRAQLKDEFSRDGGLADALSQVEGTARAIKKGGTGVPKNTNLAGLVVVRGETVGLNGPLVRDLLRDILTERGVTPIVKYEVVNDFSFYQLIAYASTGRSIGKLVHELRGTVRSYSDLDHVIFERVPELPDIHLRTNCERSLMSWRNSTHPEL